MKHYDKCYFLNYNNYDLSLYEIGSHACPPSYSFGPVVRDHYILHYVINGTGRLYMDGNEFVIKEDQAFIIFPNVLAYYQAEETSPWNYNWIHIDGPKASDYFLSAGITISQPVFQSKTNAHVMRSLMNDLLLNSTKELYCIGKLYEIFDFIIENSVTQSLPQIDIKLKYVETIVNFIRLKYNESITTEDIANACGLDRSYLTRLFKNATGLTPKDYLLKYRMKMAVSLLSDKELPLNYIAYSIGYSDAFSFSKAFKNYTGMSPNCYRKSLMND